MTDPITSSHKTVFLFLLFFPDNFAKCLDSERDGVSHEAMDQEISSSKEEDSQEWNYQGQGGCFASIRVCHYQPAIVKAISDVPPANDQDDIQ